MGIVQRDDGALLIIQRRDTGTWSFPAGYCDLGENVAKTAVRELLEETGYRIRISRLLGIYSNPQFHYTFKNGDKVKNVGVVFLASVNGGVPKPEPSEIMAIDWLQPEQVLSRVSDHVTSFG